VKESVVIFKPRREDVYDWHGNQLLPESRGCVGVGNVVRLQFMDRGSGWGEVIYVRIVYVRVDKLYGEVLDTFRLIESNQEYVRDGEIIEFGRDNIIEIPFDWEENDNLKYLEKMRTGLCRAVTGWIEPE